MAGQIESRKEGQECLFNVQLDLWLLGLKEIYTVVSRLMSNHTRIRAPFNRIKIATKAVYGCGEDYETVDHILWSCSQQNKNYI
jgi:hypothetical protein